MDLRRDPHNLVLVSERGRRVGKDVASATIHALSDRMEGAGVIWINIYSGTDFRALQRMGSRGYLRGGWQQHILMLLQLELHLRW